MPAVRTLDLLGGALRGLRGVARDLALLLLPARCAGCDASLADGAPGVLCSGCRARLAWLPSAAAVPTPPGLDACFAPLAFEGEVEAWVRRFKYPAPGLAGLDPAPLAVLADAVRELVPRLPGPRPGAVVPVPLHPRRLRARGFNPAALLARELARTVGARLDAGALRRVRDTPSQTGLDRVGRRRNVRGAFRARPGAARWVWLVDDVVTTGSTLGEAARELRRAGARRVLGVCAARTP